MVKILIGLLAALVDRGGRLFRLRILCPAADRERGRGGLRGGARERRQGEPRQGLVRPVEPHHHGRGHCRRIGRAAAGQREDRPVRRRGREPAGGRALCRRPHRGRGRGGRRNHGGAGAACASPTGAAHRGRRITPARPARCGRLDAAAAADIYRFALEHFAAVTAKSVVAPTVAAKMTPAAPAPRRAPATTPIRASRCATSRTARSRRSTIDRVAFTVAMRRAGQDRER